MSADIKIPRVVADSEYRGLTYVYLSNQPRYSTKVQSPDIGGYHIAFDIGIDGELVGVEIVDLREKKGPQ